MAANKIENIVLGKNIQFTRSFCDRGEFAKTILLSNGIFVVVQKFQKNGKN